MISRNGKENFFAAHYDWICCVIGVLALLAGGAFYVMALGEDAEQAAAEAASRVDALKGRGDGVAPAELDRHVRVLRFSKAPATLAEVTEKDESFLASGRRMYCANEKCLAPIPAGLKSCPICKEKQPEDEKVLFDTDGDGLPDEWEKRFGFNANDAADAAADADDDGFTNLEEFQAKTDPKDSLSHPDYLDSLKLALPLKETLVPFYFRSALKTPSGMKLEFFDPKKRNDYGKTGYRYSVLEGSAVGDTGYVVKKYVAKTERRKIKGGGGAEREYDVSYAELERKGDGKAVRLTVGDAKRKPIDLQAKLVFERGKEKEILVVKGGKIDIRGTAYVVKDVKSVGKGACVTLEHPTTGATRDIKAEQ